MVLNLYKRLFAYAPEKKWLAVFSMIAAAFSSFFLIASYWYLWQLFYELLVTQNYSMAIYNSKLVVIYMILDGIIYFMALMLSHLLGFRVETNIRKIGLVNLLEASFSFFDKHPSGAIRKIIDDNAGQTHTTVAHLIPDNVVAVILPLLMIIMTFMIDYRLGILLLISIVIGIFQYSAMNGGEEFMMEYTDSLEKMSAEIIEYVRGMQVLKIFGITVRSYKSLLYAITSYAENTYKYSLRCKVPFVSFQTLFNTYYLVGVPVGLYFITQGESAPIIVTKVAFFACFAGIIFASFMRIMFAFQNNFNAKQVLERLDNLIVGMKQEKLSHGQIEKMRKFDIAFENVSFKYEENYIIKDLSFYLEEGKTYAFVGPSGSRKSTLAKLISGFYAIQEGQIKIGGHTIREYAEETLLKNISFVFQHSKLFKKSIYENVKIGNPKATREEVLEALRLAQCQSILDKLPEREHTIIGSTGIYLSGGETQRVAIARAILKNANLIILDEASASTDPENEYELQQALSHLIKGKTTIMIAHRLSSIRNVDEILFIEKGQIVERGSYEELIKADGRYKAWNDLYYQANDWRVM